jgi:hypothetical protein
MSDFELNLRWISRMTFFGWVGVLVSVTVGILIATSVFTGILAVVLGVVAAPLLVVSIKLLLKMSFYADEMEDYARSPH